MKYKPTKKCEWCEKRVVMAKNKEEEEWVRICKKCLSEKTRLIK